MSNTNSSINAINNLPVNNNASFQPIPPIQKNACFVEKPVVAVAAPIVILPLDISNNKENKK